MKNHRYNTEKGVILHRCGHSSNRNIPSSVTIHYFSENNEVQTTLLLHELESKAVHIVHIEFYCVNIPHSLLFVFFTHIFRF